jgi:rubrerythrin
MDLKELFVTAIQGELEGRELYLAASEKTSDKKAKKVFKNLSDEEDSHSKALQKIAEQMLKGQPVTIPQLKKLESFDDAESPIFTQEFKNSVKEKHFEVSALRIGMKLESESTVFYRNFAKEVTDPKVKEFLEFLSSWESEHYNQLKKQVGFLEDFYLTQNSLFRF